MENTNFIPNLEEESENPVATEDIGIYSRIVKQPFQPRVLPSTSLTDTTIFNVSNSSELSDLFFKNTTENMFRLVVQIEKLEKEIIELKELLLKKNMKTTTFINGMIDNKYIIKKQIPIIIEESIDETIAYFSEANIFSSGNTTFESIKNLKSSIVDYYIRLKSKDRNELGKIAIYTLDIIEEYIEER